MKKLLAVALAVVMMLSISTVAFANMSYNEGTFDPAQAEGKQTNEVIVQTAADVSDDEYTVTVPATPVTVAWGDDEAKDVGYDVRHSLVDGSTLVVEVAKADLTGAGGSLTLTLAGTGTTAQEFVGFDNGAAKEIDLTAAVSGWDAVAPGAYSGTITYTATYTPAGA